MDCCERWMLCRLSCNLQDSLESYFGQLLDVTRKRRIGSPFPVEERNGNQICFCEEEQRGKLAMTMGNSLGICSFSE